MQGSVNIISYLLVVGISLLLVINGQAQSIEQLQAEGTRLKKEHGKRSAIYLEHQLKLVQAYSNAQQFAEAKTLNESLSSAFKSTEKAIQKGKSIGTEEEFALHKVYLKHILASAELASGDGLLTDEWNRWIGKQWFEYAFLLEQDALILALVQKIGTQKGTTSNMFLDIWEMLYETSRFKGKQHHATLHQLWQYFISTRAQEFGETAEEYISIAFAASSFYQYTDQLKLYKKYRTIVETQWPSAYEVSDQALDATKEKIDAITDDTPQSMPRFYSRACETMKEGEKAQKSCSDQALLKYLYENIVYPKEDLDNAGSTMVVTSFTITIHGTLVDIQTTRPGTEGMNKESKRLLQLMNERPNRWISGIIAEEKVPVRYNLPLRFKTE